MIWLLDWGKFMMNWRLKEGKIEMNLGTLVLKWPLNLTDDWERVHSITHLDKLAFTIKLIWKKGFTEFFRPIVWFYFQSSLCGREGLTVSSPSTLPASTALLTRGGGCDLGGFHPLCVACMPGSSYCRCAPDIYLWRYSGAVDSLSVWFVGRYLEISFLLVDSCAAWAGQEAAPSLCVIWCKTVYSSVALTPFLEIHS